MRLWVESAHEVLSAGDVVSADVISTLTTEEQFVAAFISDQGSGVRDQESGGRRRLAQRAIENLDSGAVMGAVMDDVLAALPAGEHVAIALLRVGHDGRASLAEIDAPPLFMARRGEFVVLPVTEEERDGRLVRCCDFTVADGDHLALVSESYIRARGGIRPWSWRDIAVSIRRLTATGCDAEQLAGALARLAGSWKLEAGKVLGEASLPISSIQYPASVFALSVRPMRTATVWSGPPTDPERDQEALERLLAEEGVRVICGDTTAEIAARLLGAELVMEPPPAEGWTEVPPTSRLVGAAERVDLITEGAVTLGVARERLTQARRPRDLAGREDGASRLAKLLLEADKITIVEGQAVNPAQIERDGTLLRTTAVAGLVDELKARGKIFAVECM